jgi:hypothetical protein
MALGFSLAACGGDVGDAAPPALVIGTADPATNTLFVPLADGGVVPYYGEGQRRLQMQLAVSTRGLGRDVTGTFTVSDPATGARAERVFTRVLLVCEDGSWCRQQPLEVSAVDLGAGLMLAPEAVVGALDGRAIVVTATFSPRPSGNGPATSVTATVSAVLRKF